MQPYKINVQKPPSNVWLGSIGEDQQRCIVFDCTGWLADCENGVAELLVQNADGSVHASAVQQDGASVSWVVGAADTAVRGTGRMILRWTTQNIEVYRLELPTLVFAAAVPSVAPKDTPEAAWTNLVLKITQRVLATQADDSALEAAVKQAVEEYFKQNPIKTGATQAQAKQIEQNKTDIAALRETIDGVADALDAI